MGKFSYIREEYLLLGREGGSKFGYAEVCPNMFALILTELSRFEVRAFGECSEV